MDSGIDNNGVGSNGARGGNNTVSNNTISNGSVGHSENVKNSWNDEVLQCEHVALLEAETGL